MAVYPFFNAAGGFNVEALRQALATRAGSWKTILILNFPNNPTGYSITQDRDRADRRRAARGGRRGPQPGRRDATTPTSACSTATTWLQESLFARLAGCHERLLAVKVDGPTKEEFVWGFRTGMLTFSARAFFSDEALYQALEKKAAGAIRSAVSNCSHVAQSVLAKAMADRRAARPSASEKKAHPRSPGRRRSRRSSPRPKYAELWEPYPFNAGYFMCLKLKGLDAETYRKHLLEKYGVGVIADGDRDIRIAFSSVEVGQLEDLYVVMATAARDLLSGNGAAK